MTHRQGLSEQVLTGEQGPYSPSGQVEEVCGILHEQGDRDHGHPEHIQIASKSDHYSKLRQFRPPTPAQKFLVPVSPEGVEEDAAPSPNPALTTPIPGWTCPTCGHTHQSVGMYKLPSAQPAQRTDAETRIPIRIRRA